MGLIEKVAMSYFTQKPIKKYVDRVLRKTSVVKGVTNSWDGFFPCR